MSNPTLSAKRLIGTFGNVSLWQAQWELNPNQPPTPRLRPSLKTGGLMLTVEGEERLNPMQAQALAGALLTVGSNRGPEAGVTLQLIERIEQRMAALMADPDVRRALAVAALKGGQP